MKLKLKLLLLSVIFLMLAVEPTIPAVPSPPTSPNQLILTALSKSIRLNWTNRATTAVGYRIFRTTMKVGSQTGKVFPLGANALQYIDTGLEKSMTYCYCVVCYNAGGESVPEVCGCAKTLK